MAKCFKCDSEIKAAWKSDNPDEVWECPCGVHFEGGWNFGSSLYDAMMDGIHVEIIICDDCIQVAQGTDKMREVNKHDNPKKS
jgi:hypothetical protein